MVRIGKKITMGCFIEMKFICIDESFMKMNLLTETSGIWVIIGMGITTFSFNSASQAQTSVAAPQSLMIQVKNYPEHMYGYIHVNLTLFSPFTENI